MEFVTFWDILDFITGIDRSQTSHNPPKVTDYNKYAITNIEQAELVLSYFNYGTTIVSSEKRYEAKAKIILYNYRKVIHNGTISIPSETVNKICQYFLKQNMTYENIHSFFVGDVGKYFFEELATNIYNETSSHFNTTTQGTKSFVIDIDEILEESVLESYKLYRFERKKKQEVKSVLNKFVIPTFDDEKSDEFIYCIGDEQDKFNKIGKSNNPEDRLKQLQTGNPTQLYLKYSAKVDNSKFAEEELHLLFGTYNVIINGNREWFEVPSWKIISEIRKYEVKI